MKRFACLGIIAALSCAAFSQSSDTAPQFEFSDVHLSAPATSTNRFLYRRGPTMRGGRYELKSATMLDLVSIAYGVNDDKVLGGPSWLEMTRFDIIAKAPANTTVETLKPALKQLLTDRFKLVAHPDTKPMPTYVLTQGKKLQIKQAAGAEETGCKPQTGSSGARGGTIMFANGSGATTTINLGPGMAVTYQCRNITMAGFAAGLPDMFGANVGSNPVLDQTALEGRWNFDVSWSFAFIGLAGPDQPDRVSFTDAVEKQLGLKLEQKQLPTPVVVVDRVNQKPTDNLPDIAARLNVPPPPTEFDVAAVKATDPDFRGGRQQVQPGGRVMLQGMNLRNLIMQAWNLRNDMLVGGPSWLTADRWDIIAKVSSSEQVDMESVWPLMRKLLEDRFQLKTHTEERSLTAYNLVALKPKMKKADPNTRTHSQAGLNNDGKSPSQTNGRVMTYQNYTMAQFADDLQRMAPGYIQTPVLDSTGLEGGFDFTLTFSPAGLVGGGVGGGRIARGGGDAGAPPAAGVGEAVDPGGNLSLFEAVEKELGLKLEQVKRPVTVLVIDSVERKPKDN
jgi:uncharacterized protein (TIGR03435 family)